VGSLRNVCLKHDTPLYEGGVAPVVHISGSYAAQAVAQTTPQPQPAPEPAAPPAPPTIEERLALVPSAKTLIASTSPSSVRDVAKRRIAVGVSNHFKWAVDAWYRGPSVPAIGSEAAGGGDGAIREIVGIASGRAMAARRS
jgi:hypothetical protein